MAKNDLAEALKKQSEKYGFPTVKVNKPKKNRVKSKN